MKRNAGAGEGIAQKLDKRHLFYVYYYRCILCSSGASINSGGTAFSCKTSFLLLVRGEETLSDEENWSAKSKEVPRPAFLFCIHHATEKFAYLRQGHPIVQCPQGGPRPLHFPGPGHALADVSSHAARDEPNPSVQDLQGISLSGLKEQNYSFDSSLHSDGRGKRIRLCSLNESRQAGLLGKRCESENKSFPTSVVCLYNMLQGSSDGHKLSFHFQVFLGSVKGTLRHCRRL